MKKHAAPIIAALLLLLPVLYVASYFALVVPSGVWEVIPGQEGDIAALQGYYRLEGIDDFYWPLEQFDRRLRPAAWSHGPYPSSPVVDPSARSDFMKKHFAPILAVVMLLLPVSYVASYFLLVVPAGIPKRETGKYGGTYFSYSVRYRYADTEAKFIFWPVEQIDRKLRPAAWEPWLKDLDFRVSKSGYPSP